MRVRRPVVLATAVGVAAALTALSVAALPALAATSSPTPSAEAAVAAQVRAELAGMSLTDKVEQMFVTYVYGATANVEDAADVTQNQALYGVDNGAQLLAKYHLGGVIYFAWSNSLTDPQTIAQLSNGLQQAATTNGDDIPAQISTDQEGGIVNRINAPAAVSPGNLAIGATFDPGNAYRAASVYGSELRAMGINMDDAPVVDVNTNPANSADGPRSFGDNTTAVVANAVAAVTGYQHAGVAAQTKHFPGLGDTTVNTDNGVAVNNETRAQIMATDIPPFRAAIAAGVQSIMAAHIVAPALDPSGLPASLSQPIVTGLLRDTLHYNGVVITDSLQAGALAAIPQSQVMIDAINAGDDELLMPDNLPQAIQDVLTAVQNGTIPLARINQSVTRILTLKAHLGLFRNPYTTSSAVTDTVGIPAHVSTMAGIARQSITLVRNQNHALPLSLSTDAHVLVTGWGVTTTQTLANGLSAKGFTVQRDWTGSPDVAAIATAVAAAQANDLTVVTTDNAWGDPTQQNLVTALLATGKPVVVVAVGGPYDLSYFPTAPTFLATYGYQPNSLAALVDTLTGANPTGRLPVTIRDTTGTTVLAPYGTGLHY